MTETTNMGDSTTLLPWVPTPRALAGVARFRTTVDTLRTLAEWGEAEIHEALWIIHEEAPTEAIFGSFVERELGVQPADALRRVAVWQTARQSRPLRELTRAGGIGADDTLRRIGQIVDAGGGQLLEDDAEVRKLITLPPRQLTKTLRRLLDETAPAPASQAAPDPAAEPTPPTALTPVPGTDPRALVVDPVLDAERTLAALSRDHLAGLPKIDKQRLLRACDGVFEAVDSIVDAISDT